MTKLENRNAKLEKTSVPSLGRVRDFTDPQVWRRGRQLRQRICTLCAGFPPAERYALAQQLRRATISVTEMRDPLIAAADQRYITPGDLKRVEALAARVMQTVNGYTWLTQASQGAADGTKA